MIAVSTVEGVLSETVRASHGRLVALFATRTRDIGAAEDAVAHAYRVALETWRQRGIPEKPEAWLVTAARNFLVDRSRSMFVRTSTSLHNDAGEAMELAVPEAETKMPDERLKLLFAAAHPAIDEGIRAPLILQTVLGFEAREIARLFCVSEATMAQRLVRAKTKIRDARIPFVLPDPEVWNERLECVLEAIYGAYSAGVESAASNPRAQEALYLADLLAAILPDEPEALGLTALICFSASRARARYALDGTFIPLEAQDPLQWDIHLIARAAHALDRAATHRVLGRFQLEAAIHSVHADRRRTGTIAWQAIAQLYQGLFQYAPTRGVLVARAYAISKVSGIEAGVIALSELTLAQVDEFVPALVCRAYFREQQGEIKSAIEDLDRAQVLSPEGPERAHLAAESERLRMKLL